jgi:hypothetical protein
MRGLSAYSAETTDQTLAYPPTGILQPVVPFCPEAWLFRRPNYLRDGHIQCSLLRLHLPFWQIAEGTRMKASWHPLHAKACKVAPPTEVYNDASLSTA